MSGRTITVIHLDPASPTVRSDHQDVCRMHRRVVSLLGISPGQPKSRELWATPTPERLVVQYLHPLDLSRLPDGYSTGHTHHAALVDWAVGDPVRWAMVSNPIRRQAVDVHGGRSTIRHARHDPQEWAYTRLPMLRHHRIEVADAHTATGRHTSGARVTHRRVRLTGEATVLDPAQLADAVISGVGPGKAYGCGLLIVGAT